MHATVDCRQRRKVADAVGVNVLVEISRFDTTL